jgi:4-carboxymuconolactone decarboxylase
MTSILPFAFAAIALSSAPALAQSATDDRLRKGDAVIRSLNKGQPQPALEAMRRDFPFLAEATEGYALGEVWSRSQLDPKTRQMAAVAAFAALGNTAFMKIHAGYALNIGVSEDELKEIVYLTTVHAGFPRAIDAARTLSELFAERKSKPQ